MIILCWFLFPAQILLAQVGLPQLQGKKTEKPILIKDLRIVVSVLGHTAHTRLELNYYNPNDRILEGEFHFPLPQGASVSHFALEVDGAMREAVAVDKQKATQAFEAITRRVVDPGVLEKTKGNNFRARVYPIPAKGCKKAHIGFDQNLKDLRSEYLYQLPLSLDYKLRHFAVEVEVIQATPKIYRGQHPSINLQFQKSAKTYSSSYAAKDVLLQKQLAFAIPKKQNDQTNAIFEGKDGDRIYFLSQWNLREERIGKRKPKSITVFWDVSNSANNRNLEKEKQILMEYLQWIGKGRLVFQAFSYYLHPKKAFQIEDATSIGQHIDALVYDGATSFDWIPTTHSTTKENLLFSDGMANLSINYTDKYNMPIICINSANIADHDFLERISLLSNGQYIDASNLEQNIINHQLRHIPKKLLRIGYDKQEIADLYPSKGSVANRRFRTSGRLLENYATLTYYTNLSW